MDDRPHNAHEPMEKDAPFDLSAAVRHWRDGLAQAPGFRTDDLEELEYHLQDSIRELQTRGLAAEEAFMIAIRRMGSAAALSQQFSRVNSAAIWTDRMLWMLIGWAGIQTVDRLSSTISRVIILAGVAPVLNRFFPTLVMVFPLVVAALTVRSLLQPHGIAPRIMTKLLCKPLRLSLALLVLWIIPSALDISVFSYVAGQLARPIVVVLSDLYAVPIWLISSLVVLFLAKRRLRQTA